LPEPDLALLKEAALAAGEIAKRFHRNGAKVWEKADQSPVTEADLAVNARLHEILTDARPDYGWLSEETEPDPGYCAAQRWFVVDPIDGTRSFMEGNKTFAHSIAVVEGTRVVAAVVHLPLREKTYAAAEGAGAFLNGAPIRSAEVSELGGATIMINKAQLKPENWPGGVPDIERVYRPSLAYRICLAAEGRFAGMVTLRDAWEWDVAAGALIAAEAGAEMCGRDGRAIRFGNDSRKVPGMLVCSDSLRRQLLERLKPLAA
jgi:myo-inositol-1(or 4)-monophosphatase